MSRTTEMWQAPIRLETDMANFRPKKPITQTDEYFYEDTLENFLTNRKRISSMKTGGNYDGLGKRDIRNKRKGESDNGRGNETAE
jgi:hypothetical protein